LETKAKAFFKADGNKDGFLAGADITKTTRDLLDTNEDGAVSFTEWCHGFDHVDEINKLGIFQKFYGQVYGDAIPDHWSDRGLHQGNEPPKDDRHENHPQDNPDSAAYAPTEEGEEDDTGGMTDEELNAALDRDFTKMDTDSDEIVTVDEYKKWDEGNAEAIHDFNVLDRNHDGKLTRVELSGTEDHSAGSNYISHEEHEQHKQERHEKHMKSRQEAMEKAQALGENPAEAATKADHESEEEDDDDEELEEHQLRAEFDRMDTDKDHHVSEEEYAAANPGDETARHNFKLIDRNKSGKLRFKELFPETVRKKDLHYYEGKHNEHYTGDEGKDATAHEHPPDHEEPAIYAPHHEAPATGVPETGEMTEADKALQTKFVGFDSNGDTRLSAAEAEAAGLRDEEGSVKADSNKDGFVDWEEFRIWRK